MRPWLRIASILLLGILFGFPQLLSADQWVRVKSKNFTLVGNAREKKIREAAAHLEQFRAGLDQLVYMKAGGSPVPTVVVVFKDDKAFEPFKPMEGGKVVPLAGYFQQGEEVNYISLSPETASETPYAVIFHEFVHQLVHEMIDDPPVWFNEGLAEYYSTFEVGKDGKEVRVGKPIPNHIRLLRNSSGFPISALLNSSRQMFANHDRENRGYSYAQAWVFVHYLMLGNHKKRQPQFVQFVRACVDGREEPDEHFERVFKADYETMEEELKAYVRSQSFPYTVYQLKDRLVYESEMTAEPIPEAEADYYLGDLLLHSNRLIQAESYLRQALSHDPSHANARASMGMLRLRQNRVAEARKELQEAVRSDTVRPAARYFYVRSLMQSDTGSFACCDQETREIILVQLRRVIEEFPTLADSYNLLGYMNLTSDSDLAEAITMVKRGISLEPRRKEYLLTLAQLQLKKSETAAAKQTLEAVLAGTRDKALQSMARNILEHAEDLERFEKLGARGMREAGPEPPPGGETEEPEEEDLPSPPRQVEKRAETGTRTATTIAATPPRIREKAPGKVVLEQPACFPGFIDVRGHSRIMGTLVGVETLTGSPAFVLSAGGKEYVFLTPAPDTPLMYSCQIRLGADFDYTDLHHGAVVYFDPVTNPGYSGRAIAIEILSTGPLPAN